MYYREVQQDLFTVDTNIYTLVHCISADFVLSF